MKIYCVEHHTVYVHRVSEIPDEVLKEAGVDITNEDEVILYVSGNDYGDIEWETTNEDWVSSKRGGYDIDYSLSPTELE